MTFSLYSSTTGQKTSRKGDKEEELHGSDIDNDQTIPCNSLELQNNLILDVKDDNDSSELVCVCVCVWYTIIAAT